MEVKDYTSRHRLISRIREWKIKGSASLARLLAKVLLPKPSGEMALQNLHGFPLWINPVADQGVERDLFNFGSYEKGILLLMAELLEEGDTFVDIGGNIGLMTVHGARLVGPAGKVISFEANPSTAEILQRNLDLNELKNVEVVVKALGNTTATGKIYTNMHINRGGASLIASEEGGEFFEVDIVRFQDLYDPLPQIHMIKADIEGYELPALKGFGPLMSGKDAPILIVECSEMRGNLDSDAADLYQYIREINDYRIFKLNQGKEFPSKLVEVKAAAELPYHDNIVCFPANKLQKAPKNLFV